MSCLFQLYKKSQELEHFMKENVLAKDNPRYVKMLQGIIQYLDGCSKELMKLSKEERSSIVLQYEPILFKVYDTLVGTTSKLYLGKTVPSNIRSAVDGFLMNRCGIKNPERHFNFYPTRIFNDFIKGITRFKGETPTTGEQPDYHRNKSCGSRKIPPKTTFAYVATDTPQIRREKLKALETCIIERKIYDSIYSTLLQEQDIGHKRMLQELENMYMDLTRDQIKVVVEYRDFITPYYVFVEYVSKKRGISFEKRKDGTVYIRKHGSIKDAYQVKSEPTALLALLKRYSLSPLVRTSSKPMTL